MKELTSLILITALLLTAFSVGFNAFALEEYTVGDADNNGKVETADARLALQIASKTKKPTESQLKRCDVNKDGFVGLDDVSRILCASVGIERLQRTGAFMGFGGGGYFDSAEELLEYFNTHLNAIKDVDAGFFANTDSSVKELDMEELQVRGLNFSSPEKFEEILRNTISDSFSSNEPVMSVLGEDNDYAIEAIGQPYVSTLGVDDVCGAAALYDEVNNLLTVKVSLYDTTVESAALSASYSKALNVSNMNLLTTGTINKLFGNKLTSTAVQEYKNVLLTAVFDTETGYVESYEVSYDNNVYIASAGFDLDGLNIELSGIAGIIGGIIGTAASANVKGFEYTVTSVTRYTQFQWPVSE